MTKDNKIKYNNRTLYDIQKDYSDTDGFSNGFSPQYNNSNKKNSLNDKYTNITDNKS